MAVATDRYLLAILTSLLIMGVFAAERLISVRNRRKALAESGAAKPESTAGPA